MTRSERRLLVDTSTLGIVLTILVTFLEFSGLLAAPERFFYDFRARRCQRYTPPPTTQLVHVDIDDTSILVLGHWPWPRSKLAEVLDELQIGGAKTRVLDVILSEPSPYELDEASLLELTRATTRPATLPATMEATTRPTTMPSKHSVVVQLMNNDVLLAESIERFKRAVVPVSLNIS